MSDMRTEEEQIDAIKNWWKENGRSTVIGIVIAAVAVFGWRGWQDSQRQTSEAASALYQSLVSQAAVQPGQTLSDEQRKSVTYLANQLKTDYDGSSYARYAALWLAKLSVDRDQFDQAKAELEWLLDQKPEAVIAQVARLRLAQVLLATGSAEAALQRLESAPVAGFEAAYYELKGDVLLALGRDEAAQGAYAEGMAVNSDNARPLISMKLDDLAGVSKN